LGRTYPTTRRWTVTEEHHHTHESEPESGGLTGYAIAKYGFILIMVIVILWFVANYFLGD
jgi:hypothetical protein